MEPKEFGVPPYLMSGDRLLAAAVLCCQALRFLAASRELGLNVLNIL